MGYVNCINTPALSLIDKRKEFYVLVSTCQKYKRVLTILRDIQRLGINDLRRNPLGN